MRGIPFAIALTALALATPTAAHARASSKVPSKAVTPSTSAASKRAKRHFDTGVRLYKQARYKDAIAEFEAAYRERPHGVIFFNIAQSYEKLGDLGQALRAYHQYLRELPNADDRETVQVAMRNLEKRLADKGVQQLLVYSNPAGAQVMVDGRVAGTTPYSAELKLGKHSVGVEIEGYALKQREVELGADTSVVLDFTLEKVTETVPLVQAPDESAPASHDTPQDAPVLTHTTPSDSASSQTPALTTTAQPTTQNPRVWTYVAGGVGVVALATAVALGMSAKSAESQLHGSVHDRATADSLASTAKGQATGANIFYGVAGAAGVATAALFFVEGRF